MVKRHKENIIELRLKGYNYNQIVKELGCSKGTVAFHCANLNIDESIIKTDKNELSEIDKKIVELRKEGRSYRFIQKELNLKGRDKIARVCKKVENNNEIIISNTEKINHTTFNAYHQPQLKDYGLSEEQEEKIKQYYSEGYNTVEMSDFLKIDNKIIKGYIKSRNVKNNSENLCGYSAVRRRNKRIKQMAVEYKGGSCNKCGYNKCVEALDFHHVDPNEKDFSISASRKRGWKTIKIELDKCVCLCSNCHRELHAELMN